MEKKLHCGKFFKRLTSLVMAFVMLLSLMPVVPYARAAEDTVDEEIVEIVEAAQSEEPAAVAEAEEEQPEQEPEAEPEEEAEPEAEPEEVQPEEEAEGEEQPAEQEEPVVEETPAEEEPVVEDTESAESKDDPADAEAGATYIVAGDSALCGTNWDLANTDNQMEYNEETGLYEIVYYDVAAGTYNLKVTDGTWNNSWGDNGQNYTFVVSDTCDVTVTFDEDTKTVEATGDNVGKETGLEITVMNAVGNGSGNWLNGKNWDVASNAMTEVSEGVYEITFADVPAGSAYEFKFAANGSWTHSWGSGGAEGEAVYNGQNIKLTISYELADVTLKLDMTGYNHESKSGATYSVTVTEVEDEPEVPAVDYYLIGYINGADYGCNDDWENLGEYKFVDGKLTASFDVDSYVFVKTGDNANWYMAEAYAQNPPVTLKVGGSEKLFVPANKELEFTLEENEDGTLTLSYAEVTDEPEVPVVDYYMVGYINGADYGCNDDYANLGEYKFVDGKLTASFDADSYVFVKTGDNANWYMAEAYAAEPPVTLKNTSEGTSEKLFVPGGVELEFTLVENEDGTLTLSYAEAADTTDVTLHFYKTEGWGDTINAYLWTDGGAVPGYAEYNAWPGKAIGTNADHAGWYDLVVSLEAPMAFNFIFNDGGNQTADLYTGEVTGDMELWVVGNTVSAVAPGEWSGDYDYTANLHFQKPAGWGDTINAWIWDANGKIPGYEDYNTTWPGKAVEADEINSGWYNVSVTKDTEDAFSFIFNDGSNQTADLSTDTLDVVTDLWIVNGEVLTEAPEGWVDPNRTVHVPGTFPGPSWDAASNQMRYDPELGLYVYTFEAVPAANYEFKIAINGSWNENYGAAGVKDGANIAVAVPETMDVTVYYNDRSHNAVTSVDYKFLDITLSGTGIPAGTKMTDGDLTGIYSATVALEAGTYSDIEISFDDSVFTFGEFELKEDKDVTFFFEPVSGLYYHDGSDIKVGAEAIYFNSQDEAYKSPFGAVEAGEDITFSITTGEDVNQVKLIIKGAGTFEMEQPEAVAYELGVKNWTCTVSVKNPGEYDYYFVVSNGSDVKVYGDDDGFYGEGKVTELTGVMPYDLVVYEAGFETPDWMKNAVIYQIFPDRFFDGNELNNQAQTWARGEVDYEYITDWYTLPENPEQKAMLDEATYKSSGAHYGDGEWSNEIYGGDLEGITERVDYLKALGVNVIYLNPIFWSISNHRYDAVDYMEIDPILGTLGDFEELVAVAEANDMHIILDGVFNHVSDDSVYFDRYYKFLGTSEKIGAYPYWAYVYDYMAENGTAIAEAEAAAKAYFGAEYGITDYSYTEWFAVRNTTMAGAVDNIGLRAGKEVYSYEGWWGYDSMPVIYSTNGSEYQTGNWAGEIINGSDSVTQYWITKGNNGWRLDVANEVSDETWQRFRDSVKSLDSDAVIIGEIWDDATKYLMGDMYDSVMNYQFRNAVTSFAMGTGAEATTKALEKIRERYPEEAFYAMMNLVGSHDTTRILSYLDGIGDDRNQKDFDSAFPTYVKTSATAKARQYLVAFLQFTYAGAPTIYYGDEIGMVGSDDPDDRRAFEWGKGNREIVEWYATLAAIREAYPALRTGDVQPIETGSNNLMGFARSLKNKAMVVVANNSSAAVDFVPEEAYGLALVDVVSGKTYAADAVSYSVPAYSGIILVPASQVEELELNLSGLKPAYDDAYIVDVRSEVPHEHVYGEWEVVTEPTSTAKGSERRVCGVCGHTETRAIDMLPPEAPVISVGNDAVSGKTLVSWDAVEGAAEYEIFRSTAKTGKYTSLDTVSETSYLDEAAKAGVSYYYYVVAISADGAESEKSNIKSRTCDLAQPEITAVNVASTGKVKISWKAVSGAVEYKVYRSATENGTYKLVKTTTATSYVNTSAEAGETWYYKVKAIADNTNANSAFSNVVSGICKLARPVVTAANVASTGKIKLSWKEIEDAQGYAILRADEKDGEYTEVKVTDDTAWTDKSVESNSKYYYKVIALAEVPEANSAASEIVTRTCDLSRPELTLSNEPETGKIVISWTAVEGAKEYEVYRATSKTGTYKLINTTGATSFTNRSVTAGKTYYYKVRAISDNSSASSAYSSVKSRTCDLARPSVSVTRLSSTGKIKLSWKAVESAVEYKIYRSTSEDGSYKLVKTTTSTSYTDTTAKAGVTYFYKVRAIAKNTAANSAYSEIKSGTCRLEKPEVKASNVTSTGKVKLSWEKQDGAIRYDVYRSETKSEGYELVGSSTGSSWTDADAEATVTYYYKVKAVSSVEKATSAYSSVVSRTCDLARPVVSITETSKGNPKLTWTEVEGAISYKVYRATSKNGTYKLMKTTTATSYTNTSVEDGKTYYYKVMAISTNSAANSAYSYVRSIKVDK